MQTQKVRVQTTTDLAAKVKSLQATQASSAEKQQLQVHFERGDLALIAAVTHAPAWRDPFAGVAAAGANHAPEGAAKSDVRATHVAVLK